MVSISEGLISSSTALTIMFFPAYSQDNSINDSTLESIAAVNRNYSPTQQTIDLAQSLSRSPYYDIATENFSQDLITEKEKQNILNRLSEQLVSAKPIAIGFQAAIDNLDYDLFA